MTNITYKFNRIAPARFHAIDPGTDKIVGTVFGSSNNWRAEQLDGTVINNCYARKQDAAVACENSRHYARSAGQL